MITRRRLFKNLGAAVVVGAVAPGMLAEAATAAPRKLPGSELAAIVPRMPVEVFALEPWDYRVARLLTSLFGCCGWHVVEHTSTGTVDIHLPEYLDAGSMKVIAEVLWLYKPAGVLFRLHADTPWCDEEGAQISILGSTVVAPNGKLLGIEVVRADSASSAGQEAI